MIICNGNRIDSTFVSSGSVTAINKTGGGITKGDKVWLNDGNQTAGSSYEMITGNYSTEAGPVIDPTGTRGWAFGKLYNISNTSATATGTFGSNYSCNHVHYPTSDIIALHEGDSTYCFGSSSSYTLTRGLIPGTDLICTSNSSNIIQKINLETGEVLKTYNATNSNHYTSNSLQCLYFNNMLYYLQAAGNSYNYRYTFNEDDSTYTRITSGFDINMRYNWKSLGKLPDQETYLLCTNYSFEKGGGNLRMISYVDDTNLHTWTQDEMPIDLQSYYSEKSASMVFNPYTGILTLATSLTDYGILKYENGTWTKLNITLPYPEEEGTLSEIGGITLSNDLTRAAITCRISNSPYNILHGKIVNLTTQTGYVAQKYKPTIISEKTLTGFATQSAEPDASFTASVGQSSQL